MVWSMGVWTIKDHYRNIIWYKGKTKNLNHALLSSRLKLWLNKYWATQTHPCPAKLYPYNSRAARINTIAPSLRGIMIEDQKKFQIKIFIIYGVIIFWVNILFKTSKVSLIACFLWKEQKTMFSLDIFKYI